MALTVRNESVGDMLRHGAMGSGLGAAIGSVAGGAGATVLWALTSRAPATLPARVGAGAGLGAVAGTLAGFWLGAAPRAGTPITGETALANLFITGTIVGTAAAAPTAVAALHSLTSGSGSPARLAARAGALAVAGFAGGAVAGVLAAPAGIPQHFQLVRR